MILLITMSFIGFLFGIVLGLHLESDYDLTNVLLIFLTVFYLGSGVLVSAQSQNVFAKITMVFSPLRPAVQFGFEFLTSSYPNFLKNQLNDQTGLDWANSTLYLMLVFFIVAMVAIGWGSQAYFALRGK